MKNKKTKKSMKELFAFGGTAMNVDSPSEDLQQFRRITEDALVGSMYDPTVMGLNMLGGTMTNIGMSMASQGIGEMDMSGNKVGGFLQKNMGAIDGLVRAGSATASMATGGIAPTKKIEAEGNELLQVPGGAPMELKGPSHENGGIDLTVPSGTVVYSKEETKRKKQRDSYLARLISKVEKNPQDKLLAKTAERVKANNDKIDAKVIARMEAERQAAMQAEQSGTEEEFALGGLAGGPTSYQHPDWANNFLKGVPLGYYPDGITPMVMAPTAPIIESEDATVVPTTTNTTDTTNKGIGLSMTPGDALGMAGNLYGAFGALQNTKKQRATDLPEVNQFKNFGQDALKTLRGQYAFLDDSRDNQLQDLELSRTATINRNNNSTRSINTQRALNLAVDSQANGSRRDIYNQFAQQMMGVMGQEANQLNTMDQAVMTGETRRADAEAANKDAFFSNLGRNIAGVGTGIALTGKALNDMKSRDVAMKVIGDANPNFYYDAQGNIRSRINDKIVTLAEVESYEKNKKTKK